ncbi:protein of unknown function [Candidatus Nitrosocosmicus franklandus]|uniref:Uncharacterized protein n=1 Tax=Candidatus Nitrosocosmicus franklandianus TaxID=1798806 RepID=A0A484IAT4_9ARCH|nr:protein of unknown function [Candidatus Nitrosocosmicus franklandus]
MDLLILTAISIDKRNNSSQSVKEKEFFNISELPYECEDLVRYINSQTDNVFQPCYCNFAR